MISFKKKFIFVHVPKTGGTSIEHALRAYSDGYSGHRTLKSQIQTVIESGENPDEYYKFGVVRNPWDIVVSHYFYIKMEKSYWHSNDGTTTYGKHPDHDFVKNLSFKKFVYALRDGKIKNKKTRKSQSYWLNDELDYIIRFENLSAGYKKVCEDIGIPYEPLPLLNPSKHKAFHRHHNEDTLKIIHKLYIDDIKRFKFAKPILKS